MWAALHTRSPGTLSALVKAGSEIDAADAEGRTALMLAAKYNADAVVSSLLDAGADGARRDRGGKNAYDYARENRGGLPAPLLERLRRAEGR